MKKLTNILIMAMALLLGACEGPVGPPGQDGYNFLGSVFEIQGNFNSGNDYSMLTSYPNNLVVYDSDVVLVYILWEQSNGTDVWRLLPQTVVLPKGVIQYNYDYTQDDVKVFMEFTIPENELQPAETQNQIFRIAVLPAEFASRKDIDFSILNNVIKAPDLVLKDMGKVNTVKTIR